MKREEESADPGGTERTNGRNRGKWADTWSFTHDRGRKTDRDASSETKSKEGPGGKRNEFDASKRSGGIRRGNRDESRRSANQLNSNRLAKAEE